MSSCREGHTSYVLRDAVSTTGGRGHVWLSRMRPPARVAEKQMFCSRDMSLHLSLSPQ
jgi:hypothetical protein